MAALVRGVVNLIEGKGIGGFFRQRRSRLLDGNLMHTKIHNIGATVVGVDKFGNKYYEKLGELNMGDIGVSSMPPRTDRIPLKSHQNGTAGFIT